MEVAIITPNPHTFDSFNFETTSSMSPPPSTPKLRRAGEHYFSAPTSPSHQFDVVTEDGCEKSSSLFDGGVIRPLINSPPPPRGREKAVDTMKPSSRRAARSLSPIRDEDPKNSSPPSSRGHKRWWLKDLFLFRSASEGRASDKDPLKKYTASFRNTRNGSGSGSGSGTRRRGPVSAHEVQYTVNRAVSEDLNKKTFLPYKQGILGRLAFNPAAHALANGFGFSRK